MASSAEPIECQVVVLRVSIHCEGCKKKVKKVLRSVHGVIDCDIDARSNKVTATISTKLDPYVLIAKLRKSGKHAEPWPEQPPPPESLQSQEPPKNQNGGEASEPRPEKPSVADNAAAAAGPSDPQPPADAKQSPGEAPKPAIQVQESTGASNAAGGGAPTTAAAAAAGAGPLQPPSEAKGKPAPPRPEEKQPVDARVTVEFDDRGGYVNNRMPPPQPVHVMSYNVARPSASESYYATAPMPVVARAPPQPQGGYIDEQYTPPYYGRPSPYQYHHYPPPQPSPYYRYPYQEASSSSSSSDDYYSYGAPPPRDGYGDMFNDENANSCSVM